MGVVVGSNPKNVTGLVSFIDPKNSKCIVDNSTSWKIKTINSNITHTIPSGTYDPVEKVFFSDGIDDKLNLVKTSDNSIGSWGTSISLLCETQPDSYIFNSGNNIILYINEIGNPVLFAKPTNYICQSLVAIGINNNNEIVIGATNVNHDFDLYKLDINGNVITTLSDHGNYSIFNSYLYGKLHYESSNDSWLGSKFRGYAKFYDPFDKLYSNIKIFTSSTASNIYTGDIAQDDSYYYLTGYYYEHKAYKLSKTDDSLSAVFGTGTAGAGTTQLNRPRSIDVDANYVYVSDYDNHRIVILNKADMTYYSQLGVDGVSGSDNSHFKNPVGVLILNNKLYIADTGNNRIQVFDTTDFSYINTIPVNSPFHLQTNGTYIVGISDGNKGVFALDPNTDTILWTKVFNYRTLTNNGTGETYTYGSKASYVYNNELYVYRRSSRYRKYYLDTLTCDTSETVLTGGDDAYALAMDDTYMYITKYSSPYGFQRINYTTTKTVDGEVSASGTGNGQFGGPCYGIEVDANYIYVADSSNHRIQVFNKSDLSFYTTFGSYGSGADNFNYPRRIKIYNGNIYIADQNNKRIQVYDQTTLTYVDTISLPNKPITFDIDNGILYAFIGSGTYGRIAINLSDKSTLWYIPMSLTNIPGRYETVYHLSVADGKILIGHQYHHYVCDAQTGACLKIFSPFYRSTFAQVSDINNKYLIEIVFTNDYKIKLLCNGVESATIDYDSTYDFTTTIDYFLGYIRDHYSFVRYKWIGFYNKERTLQEHLNDLKNLRKPLPKPILYLDASNPESYSGSGTTWYDLSGNGYHATMIGTVSFDPVKKYFYGFSTSNYFEIQDLNVYTKLPFGTKERTIIAIIETGSSFPYYNHIFHYGTASADQAYGLVLKYEYASNHTWDGCSRSDYKLSANTPYTLAVRYSNFNYPKNEFFVNGVLTGTLYDQGKTVEYTINTGNTVYPRIGSRISTPHETFTGKLRALLVFDTYLTDDEMQKILQKYS